MRVALLNTKGGVGKSTTAVYLATGLAARGRTLLVDADPQQTVLRWSELAGDGFTPTVVGLSVPGLHRQLAEVGRGFAHVVIDTPPGNQAIARGAVLAADVVVIPTSPTLVDIDRLLPTLELLAEYEDSHPVAVRVLLTRVRARTVAGRAARDYLGDEVALPLLAQAITLRESYGASFGLPVVELGEYAAVLEELAAVGVRP